MMHHRRWESEDDSDDDDENNYHRRIIISSCPHKNGFDQDDDCQQLMKSNTKVSKELLPIGSIVECTYDYGSTTTLYLKVLSVKATIAKNLMNYYFGNAKAKT
jgi:hypothetical protein